MSSSGSIQMDVPVNPVCPKAFGDIRSPDEDLTPRPRISHPRPRLSLNLALVWSEVMVSTVPGEKNTDLFKCALI